MPNAKQLGQDAGKLAADSSLSIHLSFIIAWANCRCETFGRETEVKKTAILVLAAAALLAGCNTFEGVGKDVQSVGRTVEGAAK